MVLLIKRKRNPGLKVNPGLALTGVRTTGPRRLDTMLQLTFRMSKRACMNIFSKCSNFSFPDSFLFYLVYTKISNIEVYLLRHIVRVEGREFYQPRPRGANSLLV